jgi:hypothetical protein
MWACFEQKLIKSPAEIICYACFFLRYWAGLQKERDKAIILEGAKTLQETALAAHREVARRERLMIDEQGDET